MTPDVGGHVSNFIKGYWENLALTVSIHANTYKRTWIQSLGLEDPMEEGMATQASILAWRIRGQRSPMDSTRWSRRVGHD